jgi:hypothetical protein
VSSQSVCRDKKNAAKFVLELFGDEMGIDVDLVQSLWIDI